MSGAASGASVRIGVFVAARRRRGACDARRAARAPAVRRAPWGGDRRDFLEGHRCAARAARKCSPFARAALPWGVEPFDARAPVLVQVATRCAHGLIASRGCIDENVWLAWPSISI